MTATQHLSGPDLPAVTGTADLLGYGRVRWDQLTRMLSDAQAAWADYNGFHIGAPPATPPPYSHLWAWTDAWLARARIDADTAIVGVLALNGRPQPAPPVTTTETVHFQIAHATTWQQNEKRVGELAAHMAGRPMDIYLIPGEHPVTFVTTRPASA
jgi:hypothetical protein